MRLLTIAALLATAACTPEQHATGEHVLAALGVAPLPAALQDAPAVAPAAAPAAASSSAVIEQLVTTAQVVEEPAPVAVTAPPPPPPPNEYHVWQTDPTYVCVPVFRIKSCTDSGEPVWLDSNMGWLPFGVVP